MLLSLLTIVVLSVGPNSDLVSCLVRILVLTSLVLVVIVVFASFVITSFSYAYKYSQKWVVDSVFPEANEGPGLILNLTVLFLLTFY